MQNTFALRRQTIVMSCPPVKELMDLWPALHMQSEDDMDEPDLGDASVVLLTTVSDDATSPVHYHPVRVSVVLEGDVVVNLPRLADAFLAGGRDLEAEVQFVSAAGPFSVPIRCTMKKCDLFVDSSLIVFGTHMVGQTIPRAITLTNRRALGTSFTLVPSSCPSPAPGPGPGSGPVQVLLRQHPGEEHFNSSTPEGQESPASRTPAVSETLGGVEAASGKHSQALEQQDGGPALEANIEEQQ
ncbi:hypothetical protein J4Q44_G00213970 [Coregonus suidteri]|uniref:CFAP74 second Ig-like domain-containing protein n=1 Tax=Coregonus suidteri TaxID=861788 RepID=A0AAN8LQA9_9TELE